MVPGHTVLIRKLRERRHRSHATPAASDASAPRVRETSRKLFWTCHTEYKNRRIQFLKYLFHFLKKASSGVRENRVIIEG
jgi:hypothetical protein